MPSREAVCTIFMMVRGMTRSWREPATCHMNDIRLSLSHPDAVKQ